MYDRNSQVKRDKVKAAFDRDRQVKRDKVKAAFDKDRQAKQNKVKAAFDKDRAKKRAQVKALYDRNPQVKKNNVKAHYWRNPATKRVASKLLDRAKRALNPIAKKMRNKAYYKKNCMKLKAVRKARYLLKEPKRIDSFRFLKKLKISLRAIEYEVVSCFRQNYSYAVGLSPITLCTTSCRVTATKLLHYALEERKEQISELFKELIGSKNIILNLFKILVKVPTFLVVNHTFMRHATSIGNLSPIEVNVQLLA